MKQAVIFAVAATLAIGAQALVPAGLSKLPVAGMAATASSTYTSYIPGNAIDGNSGTFWQTQTAAPQWIQIDLGGRHAVGAIDLLESAAYRVKGYQLFISDTPVPAAWNRPVAEGELPNVSGPHVIVFPFASGRYVRLLITSYWSSRIRLHEINVYGNPARLADLQTGNTVFSDSNRVSLVAQPVPEGRTHFQTTGGDTPPDPAPAAWTDVSVLSDTLLFPQPAADTNVVLSLWFTNLTEQVSPARDILQILYATDSPVARIDTTLTRYLFTGISAAVTVSESDLDPETDFGWYGDRPIDRQAVLLSCPDDATPEQDLVTLSAPGTYEVAYTAVNAMGLTDAITCTVTVVEVPAASLRHWTGAAANALASTADNWSGGVLPSAGDHILFDNAHLGHAQTNCTWDLDVVLASWTQTTNYAGTVTIQTRYPDQGGFTNLTITGSCFVEGGVWTHAGPQTAQIYNLGLSVGGDFTLGPRALINLDTKGWKDSNGNSQVGPGGGSVNYHTKYDFGAAHGGMGGDRNWKSDFTYGSIFRPEHLGSGAGRSGGGGGALRLVCNGRVAVNGEIRARGGSYDGYGGSSGGSIFIQATELSGTNRLCVSAQAGSDAGAGGRIAVVLTSGTSFGSVVMEAFGGKGYMAGAYASSRTREGAAGTIYLQKAGQSANEGTLILDNGGLPNFFPAATTIPAQQMGETTINFAAFEAIVVRGGAVLFARPDVSLDLATANINPDGHADGWIAVMQTNNLVFPAGAFTLDAYNLVFGTNWFYPGDFTVAEHAVVSHFGSTGSTQDYGLDLSIGGDLTVASGGKIDVSFKGFLHEMGPGVAYGRSSSPFGYGASHGGRGSRTDYHLAAKTYGSFLAPTTFGSGGAGQWDHAGYLGFFRGGGAAKLTVAGKTRLDGEILALGGSNNDWSTPASGGSVWLTTGSLQGGGRIDVRGGANARPGGGGRIAVHLTASTAFGQIVLDASGRTGSAGASAAGTVYRQWPGLDGQPVGELRIDNAGLAATVLTPVPADLEAPLLPAPWKGARHVALVVTNCARTALTLDACFGDLLIRNTSDSTRLLLQGHTLRLNRYRHAGWGDEAWVDYDGGQIVWLGGMMFIVR